MVGRTVSTGRFTSAMHFVIVIMRMVIRDVQKLSSSLNIFRFYFNRARYGKIVGCDYLGDKCKLLVTFWLQMMQL